MLTAKLETGCYLVAGASNDYRSMDRNYITSGFTILSGDCICAHHEISRQKGTFYEMEESLIGRLTRISAFLNSVTFHVSCWLPFKYKASWTHRLNSSWDLNFRQNHAVMNMTLMIFVRLTQLMTRVGTSGHGINTIYHSVINRMAFSRANALENTPFCYRPCGISSTNASEKCKTY